MKKINKKITAVLLALCLSAGGVTGCANGSRIVFTTGLSGDELFKIGSGKCTMPEIMIYLTTFYNRYTEAYGEEMWNYDFGGVSLESHVKEIVLTKMRQIEIMNLMAQERQISLSAAEEKRVAAAAEAYMQKLDGKLAKKEKITRKTAENVYREYALACKVYASITEAGDMEISDDEARAVTVQTIFFPTWQISGGERIGFDEERKMEVLEEAGGVLKQLRAGEDFESLAARSGDGRALVKSYARGETEQEVEEVLFSMDEGDISDVLETADGYLIAKCISTMDYEATQANKLVLAENRRSKAFSDAYRKIELHTPSQFRERLWEKVSLQGDFYRTDADFFEIYDEYVKQ